MESESNTYWLEHVTLLRDAGANVDDPDAKGVTPLYHALLGARWEIVFSLLQLGADPYAGCTVILSEGISFAQDQYIPPGDLSEAEKEGCKVLARALRERMLGQPASERQGFIVSLSTLYAMLGYYPSDAALHECEVTLPQGRPSYFGGFADCWKGSFLGHHPIAMKTFRSHLTEDVGTRRLAREAKVWSQLRHPNVLPFLGLCTLTSVPYLISPWMENGHVLDYVQTNPDADRVCLLAQVADGLEYLHNLEPEPVIHGDLRGPNILISPSGDARIADFGLSELKADIYDSCSTSFITAGNSRWQAPEILRAETKEEARRNTTTDTFAFGRVMLEENPPFFYLEFEITVAVTVMRDGPVPRRPDEQEVTARGLDDTMWQLMMNCWDVTPSERPSAANLVARLTAVLESRSAGELSLSEESPIGFVDPPTTPDASTDVSAEALAAQDPTCLGGAESPSSEESLIGSVEPPTTPDASNDVFIEVLAAQDLTCLEETKSSSTGPTRRHTYQIQLYLVLGFFLFRFVVIWINRYSS